MGAFTVSGLGLLFTGPAANSLDELVPPWLRVLWAVTIAAGGIMSLAGALWRDVTYGFLIERTGQAGLAGACLGYGASIPVVSIRSLGVLAGLERTAVASLLIIAIGVAALQRVRQITAALARLERMHPGPDSDLRP